MTQARMTRLEFDNGLRMVREYLVTMTGTVRRLSRRALFRALLDNRSHSVETAVDVALLGRYYERLADHVVAFAQSVILMVTGPTRNVGAPHIGRGRCS